MKDKKFTPIINPIFKSQNNVIVKNILIAILDITYFIILTPIFIVFIYESNNGIVRWYIFFFSVIGFTFFSLTIGKLARKITEYVSFYLEVLLSYISYHTKKCLKRVFKKRNKKEKKTENKQSINNIIISYGR
ncbi:MAG: spore cortex biosynthesis protein YabQ [Clostridia bacterium]|nr:spore cortex biosynthesis protein YabQ [Clostridia bacterium]